MSSSAATDPFSLSDLLMTIPALHQAYGRGVAPQDVVAEVFRRIEEINDPGIFITLFEQHDVIAAAEALGAFDPEKPLWGIPFAIKDNIDTAGYETTAACPAFAYTSDEDAFLVSLLKDAGALLIGKTNLDQFATGLVGVRTPYGAPLNALDPEIVPGGSSGGSGVIVSHGAVAFALGTDTAGSGRVPAALNNIVGLKPTLGAFSASGVVPACKSIETVSVFALTVSDAYAVFQVANCYDSKDSYARRIPALPLTKPKPGLKIGIPDANSRQFFGDTCQETSFADSVAFLKSNQFDIVELDFTPFYEVAHMLYEGAWVAERYTVIEELLNSDPQAIHPVTQDIIKLAETKSAADAFRGFYRLKDLIRRVEPVLKAVDLLCVPSIPTFYTVADLAEDPITPNSRFGTYTNFVNLMDMCGIAVPTPPRVDGKPGSVTFLGPTGEDALVASVATVIEARPNRLLGATRVPAGPPAILPQAESTTITLAVCGAHMTGLPLNGHLVERGATFKATTRSAPDYRFYALAGGPPFRPGMVKVAAGSGGAIDMELWEMPLAAFGSFMMTIPAPLGIGTISLADGTSVKGFICEAAGVEGARDITHLGSWRAYLAEIAP